MAWKSSFRQNYRTTFSPTVPTPAAGKSHVVADVEAPGGEKWEHLKSGGKQWQTSPKNLPRMQRTRAIPVAWLSSGLCPDRPKGWISIIIIIITAGGKSAQWLSYRQCKRRLLLWYQQGTMDVIPAVKHLVSSLRARGAIPLLRPRDFTLRTFAKNQMASLLGNDDLETTWKVVRASS